MAQSAYRDAQATNESDRSVRIFKDLNLNFTKHPVTGDITRVKDVEAVKRSVRNLVQTNFYERPFQPELGSNVRAALFEPMSPITANVLTRHIEDVINNFEPRAILASVSALPDFDNNAYQVTVEFYVQNAPAELVDLTFVLERLR